MTRKLFVFTLITGVLVILSGPLAIAQEAQEIPEMEEMEEMEEIYEFTFGKVVKISNDQLTILEYNFETEAEAEATYDITQTTDLMNIDALSSLRIGDEVEIEFRGDNGKRVIMSLAKDEGETYEDMDVQEIMMDTEDVMEEEADVDMEESPEPAE